MCGIVHQDEEPSRGAKIMSIFLYLGANCFVFEHNKCEFRQQT